MNKDTFRLKTADIVFIVLTCLGCGWYVIAYSSVVKAIGLLFFIPPTILFRYISVRKWNSEALENYYIAGAVLWFLVSGFGHVGDMVFTAGIIAWFLIILLITVAVPSNQSTAQPNEYAGEKFKKCPFCAETIRAEAIKCRFCGSDV